jgi:hypothetical protein
MTTSKDPKTAAAYTRASVEAYLQAAGAERQRILLAIADARSRIELAHRRQARLDALVAGATGQPVVTDQPAGGSEAGRTAAPPVPVPTLTPDRSAGGEVAEVAEVAGAGPDEPAVAEPAVAQPAVAQPAVAQPAVAGLGPDEPAVDEPPVNEPAVDEIPWPGIPVAARSGPDRAGSDRQEPARPVRGGPRRELERPAERRRVSVDEDGLLTLERTPAVTAVPRD